MTARPSPSRAGTPTPGGHASDTRLRGRWLIASRLGFVALLLTVVGLNLLALPNFFASQLTPQALEQLRQADISPASFITVNLTETIIPLLAYLMMGILVFWRRSDERMALFCAAMLVVFGGVAASPLDDSIGGGAMPQPLAGIPALRLLTHVLIVMGQVFFVVFFYLFPTGRFAPRWTRWFVLLALAYWLSNVFFPLQTAALQGSLILVFWAVAVIAQIYRYRRVSTPVEREQAKWVVFGFILAFLIIAVPQVALFLAPQSLASSPTFTSPITQVIIGARWIVALLLIPIFIAIAVMRSRLWDIDVIINRALVYGTLSVTLGALYFGLVVGAQALIQFVTGQKEPSPVAVVLSTLLIAALFQPLRRRLQTTIDQRFYRRKYDAARTLAAFGATLRSEVELDELSASLLDVVEETMRPANVSLWLRPLERQREQAALLETEPGQVLS